MQKNEMRVNEAQWERLACRRAWILVAVGHRGAVSLNNNTQVAARVLKPMPSFDKK